MAHAALIENGVVVNVIVVPDLLDPTESDSAIQEYAESIGLDGTYIRTSITGSIRGKYAVIGDMYDPVADIFVTPPPVDSEFYEESNSVHSELQGVVNE